MSRPSSTGLPLAAFTARIFWDYATCTVATVLWVLHKAQQPHLQHLKRSHYVAALLGVFAPAAAIPWTVSVEMFVVVEAARTKTAKA